MSRRRIPTILRTRHVQLPSEVRRCNAELPQCIAASTCARRLANLVPGMTAMPMHASIERGDDVAKCFIRASDHMGPSVKRIGAQT